VVATTYYTFQTDRGPSGLVRRLESPTTDTLERVTREGVWVDDPNLGRHFVNPGADTTITKVGREQAQTLAERYGVELLAAARG
jgi:hypothetical protein